MNWFDTAGFANLAKSAFNTAQKTIDRALDIHEDRGTAESSVHSYGAESFFASYGLGEINKSPENNLKGAEKEEISTQEHCNRETHVEKDKITVFSQPQQSCFFPSENVIHITKSNKEITSDSLVKEENEYDSCKVTDAKIETHLTVTEMLTELTPSLLQKSLDVKETSIQFQHELLVLSQNVTEDNIENINEQPVIVQNENIAKKESIPNDSEYILGDASSQSDFCVVKQNSSNTLDSSSLLILSTSDGNSSIDYSSQKSNVINYDIWDWNSTKCEKNVDENSFIENKNIQFKTDDDQSSAESVVPVSEDLSSVDSPEQSDLKSEQSSDWLVPSHRQDSETSGDQASTDTETKDEESETPEMREYDIKSSDSIGSVGTNSSSSFVKCSIEEADSNCSHRGNSESYSASEHSDNQKYEIEHLSGHTSGEENETTTSSDIEIISSLNGENGERQSSGHLKHTWLSRTYGRRSESPNSDSSVMPAVQEVEEDICNQHMQTSLYENRESPVDCEDGLETSRKMIVKCNTSIEESLKRQTELEEILENREKCVLKLSQELAELHDANSILEREVKRLEEIRNKDSRHTSELTQEFTQRVAQFENKLSQACKERDTFKEKLETLEKETASRLSATEVERMLKEKDQMITELLEEGEKLSKQQLQYTSLIKKLRTKDKDRENLLKTQKETLDEQAKELERLRKSLGAKDDQEKKHIETIRQLTITVQQKEKDLSFLKSDLDNSMETVKSLKKSLENSYKEMIEIQKDNAEKESQAQEIALSCEMAAKEELQQTLTHVKEESEKERNTLLAQLEELQHSKVKIEQQAKCREETLLSEISQIQKRLQESENNIEELTTQISSATLPLLRQIDNLQSTYTSQSVSWEKTEEILSAKINELQNHTELLERKEGTSYKKCQELSSKVIDLEMQINLLKQEKSKVTSQLELSQMKVSMLEESKNREMISVATIKDGLIEEINKLKQDKDDLICQLESLQLELENEKQKVQKFQEQLVEKSKHKNYADSNGTSSPTMSRLSSVSDRLHCWMQDSSHEVPLGMSSSTYSHTSVYDTLRLGSASTILENLQSQLKQRDGEIALLQSEISHLEKTRGAMTQELADLSGQYELLKSELEEMKNIQIAFTDMEQKYNTLLQMYGEKVEEAEELHLDLQDVKAMYRAQLDELLKKS